MPTDKRSEDRDTRYGAQAQAAPRRRTPAGLLFHVGAGAVLVLVMLVVALHVAAH